MQKNLFSHKYVVTQFKFPLNLFMRRRRILTALLEAVVKAATKNKI
jgi:hypothetical protein